MKIPFLTGLMLLLLTGNAQAGKFSSGNLKTIVTAVSAGVSALGFGESKDQEMLREGMKRQGVDPSISAFIDLEIWIDSKADAVFLADTFGAADLFFILEGGGATSIAPFKHTGFQGGTIRHQFTGNVIQ